MMNFHFLYFLSGLFLGVFVTMVFMWKFLFLRMIRPMLEVFERDGYIKIIKPFKKSGRG